MNNKCKYTLIATLALMAWGCNPAIGEKDDTGRQGDEILLTSSVSLSVETTARAVSDFPNNGSIGLVAATIFDPDNPRANWNTYPDINNAEAVASTESGGVFGFSWRQQKYWPFDGSNLYFIAYSPAVTDQIHYLISDERTYLNISLDPNTPDVMYATGNSLFQSYNKTSGTVNLGEFRHVLSKLTIQVVANAAMSENILVRDLRVVTDMRAGEFDLLGGDDALTVSSSPQDYIAVLASGSVAFKNQPLVRQMMIFPGIQDHVLVSVTLVDTSNNVDYTGEYMVSFFTNPDNQPVILERAKNTVLTINVTNIGVEDPNRNIQLEGSLKEWDYRGDFGITIN